MEVKRSEPLAIVQYVLERLERQAVSAGSHPVLIHEGLEALDWIREENARLVEKRAAAWEKLICERDKARREERERIKGIVDQARHTLKGWGPCCDEILSRIGGDEP